MNLLRTVRVGLGWMFLLMPLSLFAQTGLIDKFEIETTPLTLKRLVQPHTAFDKVGHQFAILGTETGQFEAWAYPLKLFKNFQLSFYVQDATTPIAAEEIAYEITYSPAVATIRYTYQSFTVWVTYVVPPDIAGAILLVEVDSDEALTIGASFLPVMQPMWPAGLGGQYARWDNETKAYLISESSRKQAAYLGSPVADGISYTPAHMLSDQPNEFKIVLSNPSELKNKFIPIVMAGGQGTREEIKILYQSLLENPQQIVEETVAYYDALQDNTMKLFSPDDSLNLAFDWAKISLDNLFVDHKTWGRGMVAGLGASGSGGRPGFGWFFGGDTYINTLSLNSMGAHRNSKKALQFMHQFQREDGKMAHEITQATDYIDWFGNYPYAYIHADTSPYYIVALHDYLKKTGDIDFLDEAWEVAKKAYRWTKQTDKNQDGLPDNSVAGLGALEFGSMTGIETDIYLGAVWTQATIAIQDLATWAKDSAFATEIQRDAQKAQKAYNDKFWDNTLKQYAYGFNETGETVAEITPWSAVGMLWNLGTLERNQASLRHMSQAKLTTDWGIRMLSENSKRFEPLNYNYGAVWPFLTSWVTTAQYKNGRGLSAFPLLKATANHTFQRALGHVTEVFSGVRHQWHQESVAHQGFCTAGVVLPLVRGLVGLEANAIEKVLTVQPQLPPSWSFLEISNYTVGENTFTYHVEQSVEDEKSSYSLKLVRTKGSEVYQVEFAPYLPIGSNITHVTVNDRDVPFEVIEQNQGVQVKVSIKLEQGYIPELVILFEAMPLLSLPTFPSTVGAKNEGLKLVDVSYGEEFGRKYVVYELEGLGGKTYDVQIINKPSDMVIPEWKMVGNTVSIPFEGEGFVTQKVKINY